MPSVSRRSSLALNEILDYLHTEAARPLLERLYDAVRDKVDPSWTGLLEPNEQKPFKLVAKRLAEDDFDNQVAVFLSERHHEGPLALPRAVVTAFSQACLGFKGVLNRDQVARRLGPKALDAFDE